MNTIQAGQTYNLPTPFGMLQRTYQVRKDYGNRRDHRKIELFVGPSYVATTTWAKTPKEARMVYAVKFGLHPKTVTAQYKP